MEQALSVGVGKGSGTEGVRVQAFANLVAAFAAEKAQVVKMQDDARQKLEQAQKLLTSKQDELEQGWVNLCAQRRLLEAQTNADNAARAAKSADMTKEKETWQQQLHKERKQVLELQKQEKQTRLELAAQRDEQEGTKRQLSYECQAHAHRVQECHRQLEEREKKVLENEERLQELEKKLEEKAKANAQETGWHEGSWEGRKPWRSRGSGAEKRKAEWNTDE